MTQQQIKKVPKNKRMEDALMMIKSDLIKSIYC